MLNLNNCFIVKTEIKQEKLKSEESKIENTPIKKDEKAIELDIPESSPVTLIINKVVQENETTQRRSKRVRFDSSTQDNNKENKPESASKTLLKKIKKLHSIPSASETLTFESRKWDDHKGSNMKTGKFTPEELDTLKQAI